MTELSDELLVAYVDGQLARKQARAVEKVLDQDDVIANRAHALREAHARLERAFDAILAGDEAEISSLAVGPVAVTAPVGALQEPRSSLRVIGTMLAVTVVAGVLGWLAGTFDVVKLLRPDARPVPVGLAIIPWAEQASRAQALISRDTVEVGLESQANREFVNLQLARAIAPMLKFPDLQAQGFDFVRAQLLRDGGQPLGLILYLPKEGAPLGLYVKRGHIAGLPVWRKDGRITSVGWSEAGVTYLLAGEQPEDLLLRLTEKIRHEPLPPAPSLPPFAATNNAVYSPPQLSPRPKSPEQASPWNPHIPSPIR